jgi:hypothetical protein
MSERVERQPSEPARPRLGLNSSFDDHMDQDCDHDPDHLEENDAELPANVQGKGAMDLVTQLAASLSFSH